MCPKENLKQTKKYIFRSSLNPIVHPPKWPPRFQEHSYQLFDCGLCVLHAADSSWLELASTDSNQIQSASSPLDVK